MLRLAFLFLGLLIGACGAEPTRPLSTSPKPMRIVSLDYCADQFVMKFVPREHILAVSPGANQNFSYMRETAKGLPTVRPVAEDVLILQPDLIVRSYGGGPNAGAFFERAGIPVIEVGWAGDIEGVLANVERIAAGLGAADEGRSVTENARARLDAIAASSPSASALYMTPSGVTSGSGTLIHDLMVAAGLRNFQDHTGWRSIPLEKLAYQQPDRIAAAYFEQDARLLNAWTPSKHPVAQQQLQSDRVIPLQGAWTACGGWFLIDAVEALARGRQ